MRPRGACACFPIFDDEDDELRGWKWQKVRNGYAKACTSQVGGVRQIALAHRVVAERVLGRPLGSDEQCDHLNYNKMDNRRSNLCIVTPAQNSQRRRYRAKTTPDGVVVPPGIVYREHRKMYRPWEASIKVHGTCTYLGSYKTVEEAVAARDRAIRDLGWWDGSGPTLADISVQQGAERME